MKRHGEHAVVIGASIAGLCAARVLSEFYDRVTLFERDQLPAAPANRAAVPQGRHVHILAARGAEELGALYPTLLDDMVNAGVPMVSDQPGSIHFGAAGHALGIPTDPAQLRAQFTTYIPSRPQLEWQIRRLTTALPNVAIVHRVVSAPHFESGAVRGVLLDGDSEFVQADLVVDAAGRGTRLPVWLQNWGFERPREDVVDVGIGYTSHRVRIPGEPITEKFVVAGASRDNPLGLGMMHYEDGSWVVTTFGVAKVRPPQTFSEMCALADQILPGHIAVALRSGQPVGEMALHKYPTSRWLRYDKLTDFPAGIVPFGDAVASFNPTYGQGMTMAALQAGNLQRVLGSGTSDLAAELSRATAKTTFPVWMMNAIGDHTLQQASGPMPRWYKPVGALFDQFLGAAETDPALAEWFLRRLSLLDSLYMIPPISIVGRTVRHNVRCWWAEKRTRAAVARGVAARA